MAPRNPRAGETGGVAPQNPFPSHRTKPEDSPPPTVLIAEDSPTQAQHLRLLLEDRGYRVLVAKHGRQALDLLRSTLPTLVISDVMMPEVDGFALCKGIKSHEAWKSIPVILVTLLSSPQDVLKGLECGADSFLIKPYDEEQLHSRIAYILSNKTIRECEGLQVGVRVNLGGQEHFITAERQQILDLLITTYEDAIRLNEELGVRQTELSSSYQAIQALYRVAEGLNECRTEDQVAHKTLERILELPGVQAGWILLRQPDGTFRTVATRGLPGGFPDDPLGHERCACLQRLHDGELIQAVNVPECQLLQTHLGEVVSNSSHAAIPLGYQGRTLGVLNLVGPLQGRFREEYLKVFFSVGSLVSMALERARLNEQVEREVQARTADLRDEIEERKRTEAALRESRQTVQGLAKFPNENPHPVLRVGPGGAILYANPAAGLLLDTWQCRDTRVLPQDWRQLTTASLNSRVRTEMEIQAQDRVLSLVITPIADAGYVNVYGHDITERKRSETATRETEEHARAILDTALDAVIVMDQTGTVIEWNPQAEATFGWLRHEVLGRPLVDLIIPSSHRERHLQGLRRFLDTGEGPVLNRRVELPALHKSGKTFPVEIAICPNRRGNTYTFSAFLRDMTDRKQADRRTQMAHALTRILAEAPSSKDAVTRALESLCQALGCSAGLLWRANRQGTDLHYAEGWNDADAGTAALLNACQTSALAKGQGAAGKAWATGQPVWLSGHDELGGVPHAETIRASGILFAVACPLMAGGQVLGVLELFGRPTGPCDPHLLTHLASLGAQLGQYLDREQLKEQLRQSQKMEAIGQLAGGIAHDFNNMLTVINGYCDLALASPELHAVLHKDLDEIQKAGKRAADLIRKLLTFSRQQVLESHVLNLGDLVGHLVEFLKRLLGEDIHLSTDIEPNLGRVKADPGQIEQVVMNLSLNARDAMPRGGHLGIEVRNVQLEAPMGKAPMDLPLGRFVMLAVSDTGVGMDAPTQSRIFEPFFTTKEKGKGTGLGLATVYGIVKQSGGHIAVFSEPQQGTTFKVYLPQVKATISPSEEERVEPSLLNGAETILLVEDEEEVRDLARKILVHYGYTVLVASDAEEARRIAHAHPGPIHLVLTDVILPGTSGRQLAEDLMRDAPRFKVLYMSGYTEDAVVRRGVLKAEMAFLQKPFSLQGLARKVREVLNQP